LWAIDGTLGVSDVVVKFSQTFGKSIKVWLITKVCFDAFARPIAYLMLAKVVLYFVIPFLV